MIRDLDNLCKETPAGVEFDVKVVPGAKRTRIVGLLGSALKIAVNAPPERGKANQAVIDLLARTLDVPAGRVQILSGQTRPNKRISAAGITSQQFRQKLIGLF